MIQISLADVRLVVLDEADKMVNNDFGEAIVKLHKLILEQKKVANPVYQDRKKIIRRLFDQSGKNSWIFYKVRAFVQFFTELGQSCISKQLAWIEYLADHLGVDIRKIHF